MENEKTDWDRLQVLFEQALELPAGQRDSFVRQQAASEVMSREVIELLDAHFRSTSLWRTAPGIPAAQLESDSGLTDRLKPGRTVGPHRIQEKIGAGGMGIIYRALDTRLQRQIALKFLPNHLYQNETARRRLMVEARAACRLDHPNICVIHDIGETAEGHMYISMPFYQGETLAARISRGPLPADDAVDIITQVADGLANAHGHDIVHRDIKPANIMLTQDGPVKILDFGIAKIADSNLTQSGVGIGTLAYMAPEQLNGEQVDARTDIWAVGATLCEMLSGRTAFPDGGLQQLLKAVLDEHYDPLSTLSEDVSPKLRLVLRTALQRDPDARYASAEQMLADLVRARSNPAGNLPSGSTTRAVREHTGFEWDDDFLHSVVQILLPWLGPIAPKIVHRYASVSPTIERFTQCLEDVLPDDHARATFTGQIKAKAALHTNPPAPRTLAGHLDGTGFEMSPAQLALLEKHLLPQVGPIAGTMIRRVAASTSDWDTLCLQLSQYFSSEREAQAFLDNTRSDANRASG